VRLDRAVEEADRRLSRNDAARPSSRSNDA
jgi:hypothetical protein